MAEVDGSLYLFGGRSSINPKDNLSDLWRFDISDQSWDKIHGHLNLDDYSSSADVPAYHAKSAHTVIGDDLYLWGGEGRHGHVSDLWRLDTKNLQWEQVQPARDDDPHLW